MGAVRLSLSCALLLCAGVARADGIELTLRGGSMPLRTESPALRIVLADGPEILSALRSSQSLSMG